jgi:hypothetical protein
VVVDAIGSPKKARYGRRQPVCVGFASNPQISAVHWQNLARAADKEAGG